MADPSVPDQATGLEVAIIGVSGRFPGANGIEEFWQNLRNGVESISRFSNEELLASGIDPEVFGSSDYVNARGVVENPEYFDPAFFGYSPREAELTDPQHRLFLECAWEALESAGYDPQNSDSPTGVYAGVGKNSYLKNNLRPSTRLMEELGHQVDVGTAKDFLATRVSYKLNLTGPSVSVQTACSTSLVAVHLACQGLLAGECELALAGGSSIFVPQKMGYTFSEDGILSPDGHCRAFDAKAHGTLRGDGVGIVVLKRLADALDDGDSIWAVIKGSAVNNDGAGKVGFTAPSVTGQVGCITRALAMAEVDPSTVEMIEAHGTGTPLGDPVEVAALTEVFRAQTQRKGFCALGSVKTNIGHLDAAAGVTGLIKAVLALKSAKLPASLHCDEPNPSLDLATSPFYINTTLRDWKSSGAPRRAGVSSFGMGGTNAHVVLEEAPPRKADSASRPWQLLVLSARTAHSLEASTQRLLEYLESNPTVPLADIAYTLQRGRKQFGHRRMLVCQNVQEAIELLTSLDPRRVSTSAPQAQEPTVGFLFPGQGSQHVLMGSELYESEPLFRQVVNDCREKLRPLLGIDLCDILYPREDDVDGVALKLNQTAITQPALFVIEYALARLWMSWGVEPAALLGHSIGEYTSACLSGVFSLESALELVTIRGRLMQAQPPGAMLAVPLSEKRLRSMLGPSLSLAAINSPSLCAVSGPSHDVESFELELREQGIDSTRLHTSHAFHSSMMDPILDEFEGHARRVKLDRPEIPCISNVSGTWLMDCQATDPGYWAQHIRRPVSFSDGIGELSSTPGRILLEVGPGRTLLTLAGQQRKGSEGPTLIQSMRQPRESRSDLALLLDALGRLWLAGVPIDWSGFYANETRQRLSLPSYPFERERYWIEAPDANRDAPVNRVRPGKRPDLSDWFYVPSWQRVLSPDGDAMNPQSLWLVFLDDCGLGARVSERLEREGKSVITVSAALSFARTGECSYTIGPRIRADYDKLIESLLERGSCPDRILHLWGVTPTDEAGVTPISCSLDLGFYSLLFLAQALSKHNVEDSIRIVSVSSGVQDVTGDETSCPQKVMTLGPCKVIPQEFPNLACRSVDLVVPESGDWEERRVEQVIDECDSDSGETVIAYRGSYRWVQSFEPVRLKEQSHLTSRLRKFGVYLITGGLGRIGLELATYLAERVQAKLILVGRSELPSKPEWEDWLATHDEADEVSHKIRRLTRIEKLGGEVMLAHADVADLESMDDVVGRARGRFGSIHGVIHAAACIRESSQRFIQEALEADCEEQFRPKVHGLIVLEKLFRGAPLDFFGLFSSLASVLGGFKFAAYSAANLFLDAFAQQQSHGSPVPWVSISWDGWQLGLDERGGSDVGVDLADAAITSEEGIEAFTRILSGTDAAHVLVSTSDLQGRLDKWVKLESLRDPGPAVQADGRVEHSRPELSNAYEAPRTELERAIARTWCELLGIDRVGIYDNFFELGGHSLVGTQVISWLRQEFRVELSLRRLLDAPTVADMGVAIVQLQAQQADHDTLVELLSELEGLSDEVVEASLGDRDGALSDRDLADG